ncbi:MAG: alanine--tRNA ligase [Euryarchaeota archaeon]|nr:alanine--tRNA ligase [Euryarchaeota archaeon]
MEAKEYENAFFEKNAFRRRACKKCGEPFWSVGSSEVCSEVPCTPYSFQGNSPFSQPLDLTSMRELYLSYFERRGHARLRRYPVVPRWRNDVMFVQASVYDFQPWVTSGAIPPPANPLTISQPCMRFTDIENVGTTGRHLTMFEMMAHHAFNGASKEVYWKDRTVELCHELVTSELGARPEEISYKEEAWEGGGNLGPSVSVGLRGLEIATLVFMQYVRDGDALKPMPLRVVDTGYGLERFTWMSQGTPTIYEAVFPGILKDLPKDFTLPEAAVLADHAKNFLFLFTDGIVPSNVREGYLARLLLRRILRTLEKHPGTLTLFDLMQTVVRHVAKDFPELASNPKGLGEVLRVEEERFSEAIARGRTQVRRLEERLKKEGRSPNVDDLVMVYDSLGVTPDVAVEELSHKVEVPSDFFAKVAELHTRTPAQGWGGYGADAVEAKVPEPPPSVPPTIVHYHRDPYTHEFTGKILWRSGPWVILDQTYFYPTGGGQITDRGHLAGAPVEEVVRHGPWVMHRLSHPDAPLPEVGAPGQGRVDPARRRQLMTHHTATHLLNGALRKVLGPHVWQAGAYKGVEGARLDITHWQGLTPLELRAVERLVNSVVREDRPVRSTFEPRAVAEEKFGYGIYQGGAVPGKELRIVDIENFDVEACGGTHCTHTSEVGFVKVLGTERIQDGMVRLHFVAGERALEVMQEHDTILQEASQKLAAPVEEVPRALDRLLDRLKESHKEAKAAAKADVAEIAEGLWNSPVDAHPLGEGHRAVVAQVDLDREGLQALAREITSRAGGVALLAAQDEKSGTLFFASSDPKRFPARDLLAPALKAWGGKGGGNPSAASGSGPRGPPLRAALDAALARARELAAAPPA